jgi:hypothetical protein
VDAEEVGEDGGGQVGGERGEGSVAGGPGADAVAVELVVEAVQVQRLAGIRPGNSQRGASGLLERPRPLAGSLTTTWPPY